MSKVLISMPEKLLLELDYYCAQNHYERSEFIRQAIRDRIGTVDRRDELDKEVGGYTLEGKRNIIETPKKSRAIVELDNHEKHLKLYAENMVPEIKVGGENDIGTPTEKLEEKNLVEKVLETIEKQKDKPLLCPKHGGQLVGISYSCGCV